MGPLAYARVVEVRPEGHSVDVVLMQDGRRLPGVQILAPRAGGDFGSYGLGIPTETGYDAKTTQERDVFCIVGWVGREPFVLGFLFPQVNSMLFEDKERSIDRHPSDVYSSIDGDGNFELHHPSGAYARIAEDPAHEDLSGKDYRQKWAIKNNTDKRVHLHVEQAGGVAGADIDPDGNIKIWGPHLLIDVPITHMTGRMTIDGSLHVVGDIGSEGDVIAENGQISLGQHVHTQVQPGAGVSGKGQTGTGMPPKDN
jgi:hypothetical protein